MTTLIIISVTATLSKMTLSIITPSTNALSITLLSKQSLSLNIPSITILNECPYAVCNIFYALLSVSEQNVVMLSVVAPQGAGPQARAHTKLKRLVVVAGESKTNSQFFSKALRLFSSCCGKLARYCQASLITSSMSEAARLVSDKRSSLLCCFAREKCFFELALGIQPILDPML